MTDWQKVRVTFSDADGNEVSAVGWTYLKVQSNVFTEILGAPSDGNTRTGEAPWSICVVGDKVKPIRELPTGVGAVIAVKREGDDDLILSRDAGGWWNSVDDSYQSDTVESWDYEILSEGIQL